MSFRFRFVLVLGMMATGACAPDTERVRVPFARHPDAPPRTPLTLDGQTIGTVRSIEETWPGVTVVLTVRRDTLPRNGIFYVTRGTNGSPEIIAYPLSAATSSEHVYVGTDSTVELLWLRTFGEHGSNLASLERWIRQLVPGRP